MKRQKKTQKKIRYAVVGLGHIAQVAVLPGFKNAKTNSELVAFVTGDPDKAQSVSLEHHENVRIISYYDYDDFLNSGEVDAVYIALPNDMHYPFVRRALLCNVHVLCEKPFTLNSDEALELYELAQRRSLSLMVAYRLHFETSNLRALKVARSGQIGKLRYFSSNFSFQIEDPDNIRLQSRRGGGPLWDIGIYCLNAARSLFGEEPIEVMAMAEAGPDSRFDEVDEMVSVILRFPENRLAQFLCSFGAADAAEFVLYGTEGFVCLESAYEYTTQRKLELKTKNKMQRQTYKKSDQFGPEIFYFSDCILKRKKPEPSAIEGLMDVCVIEAILESIETRRAVRLQSPRLRWGRPQPEQKIYKSARRKPKEIGVNSPHH